MSVWRSSRNDMAFEPTCDPRFTFESLSFRSAFLTLMAGIERHAGLMVLMGPAGCGKTTLMQSIQDMLARKHGLAFCRLLASEALEGFHTSVLNELRLAFTPSSPIYVAEGRLKVGTVHLTECGLITVAVECVAEQRLEMLARYLGQRTAPTVLLVDDADCLPDDRLSALMNLAAYCHERQKLQLVLAGRSQLEGGCNGPNSHRSRRM
jgi:type II secretory pathway predicted ATPase ExeA